MHLELGEQTWSPISLYFREKRNLNAVHKILNNRRRSPGPAAHCLSRPGVIESESHTIIQVVPVAVAVAAAVVAALEAAKGSSLQESRWSLWAEIASGALRLRDRDR